MKKKLVLFISIVAALAVLAAGVAIFVQMGDCTATIGTEKSLAGDNVVIPLKLSKNSGMWGGQIIINYDSDAIDFVSCENGELFEECASNDNEGQLSILVNQSNLKNTKKSGILLNLKFTVKETAKSGSYKLSFDKDTNFCDADAELVDVELKSGEIIVK